MFQFRRFPTYAYLIQRRLTEYCSAGFPHSEIRGYNAYVQLPTAYRSLSRPSSALDAKAFPLRSFQLDLLALTRLSQSRDIGSHKNYAGLRFGFIVVCVTLILKVHKKNFVTSLLLARNFLLASLFSFQGAVPTFFKARLKCSSYWTNTSIHPQKKWWAQVDSNHRPHDYQSCALAS